MILLFCCMMMLFVSMPNVFCVPDNVIYVAHLLLQIVCYCCTEIGGVYVCIMYRVLLENYFIVA
jgi:hypothetical protein